MTFATIGRRYQVVIPAKERRSIALQPNQKVDVTSDGERIIIEPVGTLKLRGIMKDLNDETDAVDYVGQLRREWDRNS